MHLMSKGRLMRRMAALAAVGSAISLVGFPGLTAAKTSRYSYRDPDCTHGNIADPLNVIFYGRPKPNDDISGSASHYLDYYFHWNSHDGSSQYARGDQGCFEDAHQNADDNQFNDRYHIREFTDYDIHPPAVLKAVGDAHRDHVTEGCFPPQHVSIGYDQPRDLIASNIRTLPGAYRHFSYMKLGNTRRTPQCDGTTQRSNGNQLAIHLKSSDPSG